MILIILPPHNNTPNQKQQITPQQGNKYIINKDGKIDGINLIAIAVDSNLEILLEDEKVIVFEDYFNICSLESCVVVLPDEDNQPFYVLEHGQVSLGDGSYLIHYYGDEDILELIAKNQSDLFYQSFESLALSSGFNPLALLALGGLGGLGGGGSSGSSAKSPPLKNTEIISEQPNDTDTDGDTGGDIDTGDDGDKNTVELDTIKSRYFFIEDTAYDSVSKTLILTFNKNIGSEPPSITSIKAGTVNSIKQEDNRIEIQVEELYQSAKWVAYKVVFYDPIQDEYGNTAVSIFYGFESNTSQSFLGVLTVQQHIAGSWGRENFFLQSKAGSTIMLTGGADLDRFIIKDTTVATVVITDFDDLDHIILRNDSYGAVHYYTGTSDIMNKSDTLFDTDMDNLLANIDDYLFITTEYDDAIINVDFDADGAIEKQIYLIGHAESNLDIQTMLDDGQLFI